MQTNTVVRSSADFVVTRMLLLPRHPARHAHRSKAGFLARGSVRFAAFPSRHWRQPQWRMASARRLQLRGQRGFVPRSLDRDPYHIPSSLSRERPSIRSVSTHLRPPLVNGRAAERRLVCPYTRGVTVSLASARTRLLLAAITADDPAWAEWQADKDASPQAARIVLQR